MQTAPSNFSDYITYAPRDRLDDINGSWFDARRPKDEISSWGQYRQPKEVELWDKVFGISNWGQNRDT